MREIIDDSIIVVAGIEMVPLSVVNKVFDDIQEHSAGRLADKLDDLENLFNKFNDRTE